MSKLTSPLCVIDTETTGLKPFCNEVIGICILPLHKNYDINDDVPAFEAKIQPENWATVEDGALKVNGETRETLATYPSRKEVIGGLNTWFSEYFSDEYNKIHVLAHNAPFDKAFLSCMLDPQGKLRDAVGLFTHYRWRCSQASAQFVNDCSIAKGNGPVFPNLALTRIAKQMAFVNPAPHTALGDCITTAYVYKKLVRAV